MRTPNAMCRHISLSADVFRQYGRNDTEGAAWVVVPASGGSLKGRHAGALAGLLANAPHGRLAAEGRHRDVRVEGRPPDLLVLVRGHHHRNCFLSSTHV